MPQPCMQKPFLSFTKFLELSNGIFNFSSTDLNTKSETPMGCRKRYGSIRTCVGL